MTTRLNPAIHRNLFAPCFVARAPGNYLRMRDGIPEPTKLLCDAEAFATRDEARAALDTYLATLPPSGRDGSWVFESCLARIIHA